MPSEEQQRNTLASRHLLPPTFCEGTPVASLYDAWRAGAPEKCTQSPVVHSAAIDSLGDLGGQVTQPTPQCPPP